MQMGAKGKYVRTYQKGRGKLHQHLPDYLNDLNAIHAAINAHPTLCDSPCFYNELEQIIGRDKGINLRGNDKTGFSGWIAHATAKQLAEAFLKTLSLWEESE